MNITLYESEQPQIIVSSEQMEEQITEPNEEVIAKPESNIQVPTYSYLGILEIPKINLKNGFYDLNYKYNNVEQHY